MGLLRKGRFAFDGRKGILVSDLGYDGWQDQPVSTSESSQSARAEGQDGKKVARHENKASQGQGKGAENEATQVGFFSLLCWTNLSRKGTSLQSQNVSFLAIIHLQGFPNLISSSFE